MKKVLGICMVLWACSLSGQDILKWAELGQQAELAGDAYGAVYYFGQAFALDSTDLDMTYAYAESLRAVNEYRRAKDLYVKVYLKDRGRRYPYGAAHIAQMMMHLEDYESSIEFWRRAKSKVEKKDVPWVQQRMKSCAFALVAEEADEAVQVQNAGPDINSTESDFGATWQQDTLLFSSMRGDYDADLALKDPLDYRIQLFAHSGNGTANSAITSADGFDRLNPAWDKVGERLYYTRCDEEGSCAIFQRVWPNGPEESLPAPVNVEGAKSSMPFPCVIDGADYLLFASKRNDGQGGWDIYGWQQGSTKLDHFPSINTAGDDITPSYDPSEDLIYFSSDWHEGFGGQDIFSISRIGAQADEQPKNLGRPFNTSVNDMYFRWYEDRGLITSNREGSMSVKGTHCCNDIYIVSRAQEEELVLESDSTDQSIPIEIQSVDELKDKLPIQLFFHNDVPDPGSVATFTELSYDETARTYLNMLEEYQSQSVDSLAEDAITKFFDKQVKGEFERLDEVTELIRKELEKGRSIEVAVKGFASPLAKSDYNRRLTQRRISSVVNYFERYQDGVLLPYLDSASEVKLKIRAIPYGEDEASSAVSDRLEDRKNSVYSLGAALERKVEILKVIELD